MAAEACSGTDTLMGCAGIVSLKDLGVLEKWSILIVAIIAGLIGLCIMFYIMCSRVLGDKKNEPQICNVKETAAKMRTAASGAGARQLEDMCDENIEFRVGEASEIIDRMEDGVAKTELTKGLNAIREHKMVDLAIKIQEGSKSFMTKEYTILAVFVIVMCVIVGFVAVRPNKDGTVDVFDYKTLVGFLVGAILSSGCGWLGMWIAVRANVRTCMVCWHDGLNAGLQLAFGSGAVMGLSVVCSGVLGLCFMIGIFDTGDWQQRETSYLAGFGFGASAIALFARVGGGIYTKAADVGADLVGKVEAGIPEDDPRNPATIADNVGDNVGDVAGMGADLFESFVGSIIASIQLAPVVLMPMPQEAEKATFLQYQADISALVALPFWIAGFGIVSSIIGIFMVRTKDDTAEEKESEDYADELQDKLLGSINMGIRIAAVLSTILTYVSCGILFGWDKVITFQLWGCTAIGLLSGILIGMFTEYATSFAFKPTRSIAKKSRFGHAGSIIQGLGVGMISTVVPVCVLFVAIITCYALGNTYGIAIAAVGMLSTLGVTLATDAFGPVADNAGGIAEMAELPEEVRQTTDGLDALGNTTAATGKGFAIGSAVLTSLALLAAYKIDAKVDAIDVSKAGVLSAAIFGACLPYIFAALTMMAVGRSAAMMIDEVRKQFAELNLLHPDPAKRGKPDCEKCIAISTEASLKEMLVPGVLAIVAPLFIGYLLNAEALGGMLVGGITSGCMLAIYMANAGGAWDNAKKWIEAGGLMKAYGKPRAEAGKGSDWHKAAVTGDTVGDPFKDTSGPALNILIKLMTMIALVFSNTFANGKEEEGEEACGGDNGLYCRWWVGMIIGLLFLAFAIGVWIYMRKTGFGKIDFDKVNTLGDPEAIGGSDIELQDAARTPEKGRKEPAEDTNDFEENTNTEGAEQIN